MNVSLSLVLVAALAVGAVGLADVCNAPAGAKGVSQQQFHDNCTTANGRHAALSRQVVCTLGTDTAVICRFGVGVRNCLWTGAVTPAALMRILHDPAVPATMS